MLFDEPEASGRSESHHDGYLVHVSIAWGA